MYVESIGSADEKSKYIFIIISALLIAAFFLPCYRIEAVAVFGTEILEVNTGSFSGFEFATATYQMYLGFVFFFFLPLLFPIIIIITVFKNRDNLVNKKLYFSLLWLFIAGIAVAVYIFFAISALGETSENPLEVDLTAIQITDILFGTGYYDDSFQSPVIKVEMSVFPAPGAFLTVLFYLAGIVFSIMKNSRGAQCAPAREEKWKTSSEV